MLRNEHVLHNLPGPGRALISIRLRRHLRLLLSSRVDGGMKNEEETESHVQKARSANHFILVIWGRHDVMLHDFFIFDWCHKAKWHQKDNSAPCCALWVCQFGKIFLSICSNPWNVGVFNEELRVTSPCRADRTRVAGKRSERIQPIGRFANAEMFSWEERLHQTTFSYFFDACWLLLEVIHFAFQSDEATWRWNHLVGLPTHTKKHRRWSQWNDRLDLYREVKMFIWIESHRMLLTLEISWVLPFHEDVAR